MKNGTKNGISGQRAAGSGQQRLRERSGVRAFFLCCLLPAACCLLISFPPQRTIHHAPALGRQRRTAEGREGVLPRGFDVAGGQGGPAPLPVIIEARHLLGTGTQDAVAGNKASALV